MEYCKRYRERVDGVEVTSLAHRRSRLWSSEGRGSRACIMQPLRPDIGDESVTGTQDPRSSGTALNSSVTTASNGAGPDQATNH
jgi:hypothetical protein